MSSKPRFLITAAAVALALVAGTAFESSAHARGHVNAKALASLKGKFEFGMTPKQVLGALKKEIWDRYKEKISETQSIYAQDKLRRERGRELARIRKTFIEFDGKKTGWDVSIIDDQFAHNTDESMLVYWENDPDSGKDQRRFFFFHHGQLYKMFIALNSGMLKGQQKRFDYFQNLMERRYGHGKVAYAKDSEGKKHPESITWATRKYVVQALNKLQFYGSFCLVIADRDAAQVVADTRAAARKPKHRNKIIESIIADPDKDDPSLEDGNANVIDSITSE
jgi:hypothetical protein